ncbi:hypothetical protein [Halalkalicoccus salilacus]|uniref:hypothetical protein n=1 Tax=Halalkalicoccus salilacus TaxID=3117459 RepID=UPI00300EDDD3
MAERTDQTTRTRSRTAEAEHEGGLDGAGADAESGVRERAGTLFSPARFLLALALSAVGLLAGSALIPIAGGFVGVLVGTFVVGLTSERRPLAETGVAGAAVVGVSTLFDYLVWTLVGVGLPIVAVGAAVGLAVGALGGYLGSDLRDGLTREL